jgi:DUF917 family protein
MIQCAAGGKRARNAYMELTVRGATARVSPVLRKAADLAGGFIASCRNPVRAAYVRRHAALGGISMALALGEAIRAAQDKGPRAVVDAICGQTGGGIIAAGEVNRNTLAYTDEAFDIGRIEVGQGAAAHVIHVMNEYMAVENAQGERVASYPDVITTLDAEGRPVSAGKLRAGMPVSIFRIAKDRIPLSSSVRDPAVYPAVEQALGMNFSEYALS